MYKFTYFVTEGYGHGFNECMVRAENLMEEIETCLSQGWPFAVSEAF